MGIGFQRTAHAFFRTVGWFLQQVGAVALDPLANDLGNILLDPCDLIAVHAAHQAAVTGLREGDRMATFGPEPGAYTTVRLYRTDTVFNVPDGIDDATAASVILKACTADFLVERCAKVEVGWPVLVHAAAGGVGLLLVQWLKHVGAIVIGAVSTQDKAALARAAGADHVLIYGGEPVAPQVRALTDGAGSA